MAYDDSVEWEGRGLEEGETDEETRDIDDADEQTADDEVGQEEEERLCRGERKR